MQNPLASIQTMQKPCTRGLQNKKSHEIFRFTASTLDIPSRWDPRAKQSRTVALLAALCAAALFEPFHRADKKKNQNTNVFWFFLVRVVIQHFLKTIVIQFVFEVIG